jgi:hypothetical protein
MWRLGYQPYTLADFYPQEESWYSFPLEAESLTDLKLKLNISKIF